MGTSGGGKSGVPGRDDVITPMKEGRDVLEDASIELHTFAP